METSPVSLCSELDQYSAFNTALYTSEHIHGGNGRKEGTCYCKWEPFAFKT